MRSRRHLRTTLAALAFTAGALAPLSPATVQAEGLQRYTGYASPGTPSDIVKPNGDIISAADEPKAFGSTIYYEVLDRAEGSGNDMWGSKIKNFDLQYKNGVDDALKPSPGLDKKARYLYLYQVINDRGSKSPLQEATIRLIIDPALITSWGYFVRTKNDNKNAKDNKGAAVGVGFTTEAGVKVNGGVIPIATEHPVGPVKRPFVQDAPRVSAPHPYGFSEIEIGNAPKAVADDPAGEDTGRAPVAVVLLHSADFKDAPPIHTQGRVVSYDADRAGRFAAGALPVMGAAYESPITGGYSSDFGILGNGLGLNMPFLNGYSLNAAPALQPVVFAGVDAEGRPDSSRSPAIRAVFYDVEGDIPLRQGERSVLFGFTSNFPPMYEATRLRGSEFVKAAAVAEAAPVGAANLVADASEIPTPVAFEQPAAAGGLGTAAGSLGGGDVTTGGGGFGGGGIPGFGGAGAGGFTGGGGGGLSGGGGGTTGTGTQAQAQQQTPTTAITIKQQQQQQQQQRNGGTPTETVVDDVVVDDVVVDDVVDDVVVSQFSTPGGNVVPEPAAWASALVGVPFLFLFLGLGRKKPEETAPV